MLPVSILVLLALLVRAHAAALVANEELGFRLAKGFKATLFADSTLAPDIFAMTLDSKGRVVVTSHGYIKTLIDSDNDGRADQQILFAEPSSGGMGLCFDGNDLWFMGNQGLVRYRDADGNAVADAPPEKLLSSGYMEHGGHAMRKGPDGWFYFIGGNDAAFKSSEITVVNPLIRKPVAGAMLRMTEDASKVEVIAHGLRNPYDFDFNAAGDLFTYDSDVESDYFLPWYTHTRVYHLAYGGHHGWQLEGYMRSWNRPDYYPDTVDILANIGRGSPTGVITYRHGQFPEIYRNGLFILDWTFGKIFFLRLDPQGSSYRARVELFLEPIGSDGFAPSDIVVAPDGGIYVSIGGRKTRGAIYKIDFEGASSKPPPAPRTIRDVLNAPQPLDAWSRASWVGKARELGAAAFTNILSSDEHDLAGRVRAIEIHTELFGALPAATASFLTKTDKPELRARTAWALGRAPSENAATLLTLLATDREAEVRAAALEAIAQHPQLFSATALQSLLLNNFGSIDKRLRQLSAGIASAL
ncbi:MAG: hypothetical protein SFY81_15830, partial [Verrucomicrobiota bacterium]|nr:hypothetical protein [Verrucomicrobiota bacterium]